MLGRKTNEIDLNALLGQWTQHWAAHDLMHILQSAGVPAAAVQTNKEVIEDPQLAHRGHFIYMDHTELGRHPVQRSEFRLTKAQAEYHWPSPRLGQHTVAVCKEILGMSDDEIASLIEAHILEAEVG